jgi:hypothetical protein
VSRRPRGEAYWLMQVAACGNHCCAPGCPKPGPYQQGHIELHGAGFGDEPENLIPLCPECNHKYQKVRTPDGRPEGWRERLIQLLGFELQPKFMVLHQNSWCYTIPAPEGTESKDIIKWPQPEFMLRTVVFTPSGATRKHAFAQVEKVKRESRERVPAPYLPKSIRNTQLVKFAEGYPETFLRTCREFLLRRDFVREDGVIREDSWGPLCDNFLTYKRWAEERAARVAEQEKRAREEGQQAEQRAKVSQLESLWDDYFLAAMTPDWPGMPDADGEFKKWPAVEGEELRERSLGVLRRFKHHQSDELLAAKQKLRDKLAQCAVWALRFDKEGREQYLAAIKGQMQWVDTARMAELEKNGWSVDELHASLDHNNVPDADWIEKGDF